MPRITKTFPVTKESPAEKYNELKEKVERKLKGEKPFYEELEIHLIKIRSTPQQNIHDQLIWLAESFGLLSLRDKDKSCYRLFIELVKCTKTKQALTSDELANRLSLSRATTIHHLKNLIKHGLVKHIDNRYVMTTDSLIELMQEIDNNYKRTMKQIAVIAKKLDDELQL